MYQSAIDWLVLKNLFHYDDILKTLIEIIKCRFSLFANSISVVELI